MKITQVLVIISVIVGAAVALDRFTKRPTLRNGMSAALATAKALSALA